MNNPHPWNITSRELATAIAGKLPEPEIDALVWAHNYSAAKVLSYTAFATASGISADTLRKLATGTYLDPRDASRSLPMPPAMLAAIVDFRSEALATMPVGVHFVSTDTSRQIATNADLTRESRTVVFMQGASHIGKTTALRKYRDANPATTWLVTVTSGMGAKGLAVAICEERGISATGSLSTLTRRIGRALPDNGLLIIDDFHVATLASTPRTFLATMEFLRAIYDASGCGQLFSTTDLDYMKIQKDFKASLHQLMRRGVHHPHLGTQPQQKDVRAIIEAHGLKWPTKSLAVDGQKPWSILAALANQSGLKVIVERLRYALRIAGRQSVPVAWNHFILADSAIAQNSQAPANDWLI